MSTMSIKTFLAIAPRLPRSTSILLKGNHGIGKSQVIRQLGALIAANESIEDYPVIDRRLSQMSEGDMVGLPTTDGNVTNFAPPAWYMEACRKPCVLFLDELNRATPEVMQAAFQVVLDRELNGHKLHPMTLVAAAVNTKASYNVNEMDPALLDRFWAVDLEPSSEDWFVWATAANDKKPKKRNIEPDIVDFLRNQEKWLDPPKNGDPTEVHTSRRSWEKLSDALVASKLIDDPTSTEYYSLCLGYVGTEASMALVDFVKNSDSRITGEEIINKWSKVKAKFESADIAQERLIAAVEKVSEYILEQEELNKKQGTNLQAFTKCLSPELIVTLWSKLAKPGMQKEKLLKSWHPYIQDLVVACFKIDENGNVTGPDLSKQQAPATP